MNNKKSSFKKYAARMRKKEWAALKFGESNPLKKQKLMEANAEKLRLNMTAPEKKMILMLNELKVKHESQMVLGSFIYDFYLPQYNILIEVDGDYFHGHPDKYDKEDLNPMQRKIKRNDIKKDNMASGMKYVLLRFWECDIHDNEVEVKKEIMKHVGKSQEKP